MKNLDYLKLDEKKVSNVVDALAQLLADFHVYYANLRGLHWNVKGRGFFHLHSKYEEFYDDAAVKIDEVAERILQLGATPENRFSEYLKVATIKEDNDTLLGHEGMERVLNMLGVLIKDERKVLEAADKADDEVTKALMSDYLKVQEKTVWMLVAFLTKEPK